MPISEALRRAQKKYTAAHTRTLSVRFNKRTDVDILDKLDSVENVAGYVKRLIREDIAKSKE